MILKMGRDQNEVQKRSDLCLSNVAFFCVPRVDCLLMSMVEDKNFPAPTNGPTPLLTVLMKIKELLPGS